MSEYRHEYKYICSNMQMAQIGNTIQGLMGHDIHTKEEKGYEVRSLYFDDYLDSCLYDNINGYEPREKFRIRIYNSDASYIRLELKRKEKGKIKKSSCRIDEALCMEMMQGRPLKMGAVDDDVYRKFCLWQNERLARPKIIVEYDRIPYVYKDGNVRVTFDMNTRSGENVEAFLDKRTVARPVMPLGRHILEVKFDAFIPDFIYSAIQIEKLRQTTYSKYYMCRKYSMTGGNGLWDLRTFSENHL